MAGQRAGCERNVGAGSFAAGREASRQAQAAMCPISPQRGGGGLFAAKLPAQTSDRRQMCLRRSGATCLPLPCLFAEASEASALPTLGASRPLRSGVPCLVLTLGLAIMIQVIIYPHPKPSEARRGISYSLLGWLIMGETYYV